MSTINCIYSEEKYSSPRPHESDSRSSSPYPLRSQRLPPQPTKNRNGCPLRRSSSTTTPNTITRSRNDSSFPFHQLIDRAAPWNKSNINARSQSRSASPGPALIPPSPSSSSSTPSSPLPRDRIEEEKKVLEQSIDSHVSSSVSVSVSESVHVSDNDRVCVSSSPRFYPLPLLFKQIPTRARSVFTNTLKTYLAEYTTAHANNERRRCDELIQYILNIPRLLLPVRSNRGPRRFGHSSVDRLVNRLQHHNYREEQSIVNNRSADDDEKRVNDEDAKAVRHAVSLMKMGDTKRAVQTLSKRTPIAPINEDTLQKLKELHPQQSEALPSSDNIPRSALSIIVNRSVLGKIIRRKLNNGASGGPSGWTGKHLQPLVKNKECMEGLSAIIQDICNGAIADPILRDKLLACRLIPLSKGNGGIRPLAIGEVFCKLASCYLISVCMKDDSYRALFPKIQEGVGIKGGCENVIHFVRAARRAMGDDSIVITVDFKNAYNMRKRIDMWNCLLKHRSERSGSGVNLSPLIRYFHWAYSIPTPLVLSAMTNDPQSNHLLTMQSSEGVRQGANESSLLFSLSMQNIYEKALKGFDVNSVQAKAIQDDFTIIGKPEVALEVFKRLMELSEEHGMQVQSDKCCILPPSVLPLSASSSRVIDELEVLGVRKTSLLHLLGATIGKDEDIDRDSDEVIQWAENVAIAENEHFFQLLTHRDMPLQIAFRLLIYSGLPRLAYLCRVMTPSALSITTYKFDTLIMNTLYKLFHVNRGSLSNDNLESIRKQAQLKMKNGGLGITPYSDIAPSAFIASLANATPDILSLFNEIGQQNDDVLLTKKKYESLYQNIRQQIRSATDDQSITTLLPPSKELFDKEYSSSIPLTRSRPTHPSPALYRSSPSVSHLQSQLSDAIEKKKAKQYRSSLNPINQARILSASQPSASIWLTTLPEEHCLELNDDHFRAAIRHRLAIPSKQIPQCCRCAPDIPIDDSQHPHVCVLLRKNETYDRHQLIMHTLKDLCEQSGLNTKLVYPLNRLPKEKDIVPDLYVFSSNDAYMIDVTVAYPAASSYVKNHRTNIRPLSAAEMREKQKIDKYDSLALRNGLIFVPFVLESFGAIGKEAKKFIGIIAKRSEESNQFYAYCLRRLSITLQKGNAMMQSKGMPRIAVSANYVNGDRHRQVPDFIRPRPLSSLSLSSLSDEHHYHHSYNINVNDNINAPLPLPRIPPPIINSGSRVLAALLPSRSIVIASISSSHARAPIQQEEKEEKVVNMDNNNNDNNDIVEEEEKEKEEKKDDRSNIARDLNNESESPTYEKENRIDISY